MDKKPPFLFIGSMISLAILVVLLGVRQYRPLLLDIDSKWLVLAGVPILIALVAGRYISTFKGFGINIEVAAEQKLLDDPSIMTALHRANAKPKGDEEGLDRLTPEERFNCNILTFDSNRIDYYKKDMIRLYVEQMPNLQFFEITNERGQFEALFKINRAKFTNFDNMIANERFIHELENGYFLDNPDFNRSYVTIANTIIDTLDVMRSAGVSFVAVLDSTGNSRLLGVALEETLEKQLASAVLRSWKKA